MKRLVITATALLLVFLFGSVAEARDTDRANASKIIRFHLEAPRSDRIGVGSAAPSPARGAAAQDTTWLAVYGFDQGVSCVDEGWVSVDRTAQVGDFFRVDDFSGLGGGDFGRLYPLEGNQSMWCGARPDAGDPELCSYATLPGYGNNWLQGLCTTACLSVSGDVIVEYLIAWDVEPDYDYVYLQYDTCDGYWEDLAVYNGVGSSSESLAIPVSLHSGDVQIRFFFHSDVAYSDQDAMYDSDGGVILDSLRVSDGGGAVLPTELFEAESVGDDATLSGNWASCPLEGFGDFAGLYRGLYVVQEDPCTSNLSCVWAFINGSTDNYACGGWPGMASVPVADDTGASPYPTSHINNAIMSPVIPVSGSGDLWELAFDVYRDLPLANMVFYRLEVRSIVGGCPTQWREPSYNAFYGSAKDWHRSIHNIGSLIEPGATGIQVAIGVIDLCLSEPWPCTCHSHAPLIDNVEVYRVDADGPQWLVRDMDLFQDTFSEDGTITGTARADMANDILPNSSPAVQPGDSAVVQVDNPSAGLDYHVPGDPASGPAVYCFVRVDGAHEATPGADLIDDTRYSVVGTVSAANRSWTQIQMDSCWTSAAEIVEDRYNVDLNDNLFVPGDTVWFFFGARSGPPSSAWTYFSLPVRTATGQTSDMTQAAVAADEFTVLPAGGYQRGGDNLYVDGMNFRGKEELLYNGYPDYQGAQLFWDTGMDMLNLRYTTDRYDIRDPSSSVGNHPSARVTNVNQQITQIYRRIFWDCGDLQTSFSDGNVFGDKTDDGALLYEFMHNLPQRGGVYLCGDDVASEWDGFAGAGSVNLKSTYMNFFVLSGNHGTYGVSPAITGVAGGLFESGFGEDVLIAYAGRCPTRNDFDVLMPTGSSIAEARYWYSDAAILSQVTTNNQAKDVRFILSGFGYSFIRDNVPHRAEHLSRLIHGLYGIHDFPVGAQAAGFQYSLAQNHPNPFNPVTTINYSIAERGHVTLKVYNVAGQLVRTLVDDVQAPEAVKPVTWKGINNNGQPVSSGVYFYKLTSKDFTQTRKMVLLK
jgi:hypothetical protein